MEAADVVVVGGGVIGCAVAYSLAARGARVTLLERAELAAQASGASAGMLAPLAEADDEGPFFQLGLRALALLDQLCPQLRETTGADPDYVPSGLLRVAVGAAAAGELRARAARLSKYGMEWLPPDRLAAVEPAVRPDARGALLSPREGHVSGGALTSALAAGARLRGATILTGREVTGFLRQGGRVTGARTAERDWHAGAVVLAAGAWTSDVAARVGLELPVMPVRGQILALETPPLLSGRIIWGSEIYLVPRRDGSLFAGATVERVGFDTRVTAGGLRELLGAALRLAPPLAGAGFRRAWAGLRPGSPDSLPILGPVPALPGLYLATGHYRNGVLLSALTGELMADWILEGRAPKEAPLLSVERFA